MKIKNVITNIKSQCAGNGEISDLKTRDQVLFGDIDKECTGIVFCLWANKDVIEKAHKLNANLIISHEALFWNHGDHTDWLEKTDNRVYLEKKNLLEKYNLTVWRFHDYIHSGIKVENNQYIDGIFYGLAKKLHWEKYLNFQKPFTAGFDIPTSDALEISKHILNSLNIKESRVIGSLNHEVSTVEIPFHILNQAYDEIKYINENKVGLLVTMELNDFTLAQYIYDNSDFLNNCAILSLGHFNVEQAGMEYASQYFNDVIDENVKFISIGDYYNYIHV